jgi:hypothetical protein
MGRSCVPRFWQTLPRFTHIAEKRASITPVEVDPTLSAILEEVGDEQWAHHITDIIHRRRTHARIKLHSEA